MLKAAEMAPKDHVLDSAEVAPKDHVLESAEMAPRSHVFESSEMAPKDHVLESSETASKGHVLESSEMRWRRRITSRSLRRMAPKHHQQLQSLLAKLRLFVLLAVERLLDMGHEFDVLRGFASGRSR